jgi:acyl-CoA thioesterase-1
LVSSGGDLKWKYFNPAELPPRQVDEQPTPNRGYNTEPIPWKEETWIRKDYTGPTTEGFYLDLYESIRHGAPLAIKPEEVRRQMWVIEQCMKQSAIYQKRPDEGRQTTGAGQRPFLMLVGDSISMGYEAGVKKLLAGKFRVVRHPDNGGTSANVLAHLDEWVIKKQPNIVHFNAGLHDIAVDEGKTTNRVKFADYEASLRAIVKRLKTETKARLIWATTTPVIDEWHWNVKHFGRAMADVVRYNAVALRVMKENGVEIDDLFAAVQTVGREKCLLPDGVHMKDEASKLLAEAVARSVQLG